MVIGESDVLREEVVFLGKEESEENVALLEEYFQRPQADVSSEFVIR